MTKKYLKMIIITSVVAGMIYLLWLVRSSLYPFSIALLLAYLLNPLVCYLEHKGLCRVVAIICIYIVLFSSIIIGGSKLLALLIRELEYFAQELPQIVIRIDEILFMIQSYYQNSALPYSLRLSIDEELLIIENDIQGFVGQIVNSMIHLIKNFIGLAISPILTFYLLLDWYEIKAKLLLLLPGRYRMEVVLFLRDVDKVLAGIIRGQLTVACIVSIFITSGLLMLHLKFALIIGILAGVFDVIPYFGAIIGAAPAVMVAILESPWLAVKVIVLFFLIQQIEGNIIHPKIIGENIGLHPLIVISCVFVGGEMGGIMGMLLGVPIAAISKVLIRHLLKLLV